MDFKLRAIAVANLRGFSETRLELGEGPCLLVGPNNSGKTSILRLLHWVLAQASEDTLGGRRDLSPEECRLLLPARETRNAARRLTLEIEVLDGRRRRRFMCDGSIATLRIGVTADGRVRLNVGPPRRGEASNEGNRSLALELLRALRSDTVLTLIPASRDASSESFREALRAAAVAKLEERALHAKQAGAPAEYRAVKKALDEIREVAGKLVAPLWEEMSDAIPPEMAKEAALVPDVDGKALVGWLADNTSLRLVTGMHDPQSVDAVEVGSGLQSLLELAINRGGGVAEDLDWIIALEEPEAFLHPSAQRTLARILREVPARLLISTHSPVLVEEAAYGEVVLARRHRFYAPSHQSDNQRAAINTALLTGHGAEMAFSNSVLLVEGPGDRLFFDQLRRRIATKSGDGRVDGLAIVPVGAKTQFSPWLRLLRSYGDTADRPVTPLVVADGDAAQDVRRACANAGVTLPMEVVQALARLHNLSSAGSIEDRIRATEAVNRQARAADIPIHLLPIDLEHSMLSRASDQTARGLGEVVGLNTISTQTDLTQSLGSRKAPWMRALIGRDLPAGEVSPEVAAACERWLRPVVQTNEEARVLRKTL